MQTTGTRTVLSPIGVNVRAEPSKAAKVIATAAQGTVLKVLGYNNSAGGWFEVKGSTVTGWMSAEPALSASGEFRGFTSSEFSALYPATWTASGSPPAKVVFRAPSAPDAFTVAAAATAAKLPAVPAGYGQTGSTQVVVCGITSSLVTYRRAGPGSPPNLAQVRLTLNPTHALGFFANLSGTGAPLAVFKQFLASATFPVKQCIG